MKIYTRTGDQGETSLRGGVRVSKDSARIEVYGTIDEATSMLGMARATTQYDDIGRHIFDLQGQFITVMAEIASGPSAALPGSGTRSIEVGEAEISSLEQAIDRYEAERIPSKHFVRPGGSQASAMIDTARTFVRRAERRLVGLGRDETLNPNLVRYLNRLSDLLYVMARVEEERFVADYIRATLKTQQIRQAAATELKELSLVDCDRMIEAGLAAARKISVPMVVVVVDADGLPIELRRMQGALGISLTLAPNKAYTAAVIRMATHELAVDAQPGGPLFGIGDNLPKVTLLGGGIPLVVKDHLLGAVGASGGTTQQDVIVAQAMVEAL